MRDSAAWSVRELDVWLSNRNSRYAKLAADKLQAPAGFRLEWAA